MVSKQLYGESFVMVVIGLLQFEGAQQSALHGLRDFLETATQLGAEAGTKGFQIVDIDLDGPLPAPTGFHALICPPRLQKTPPTPPGAEAQNWLRHAHGAGAVMCSVCAGAFILASTGLLNGRTATTHWALSDAFAASFPKVHLEIDKLLIDDGDIMTAGGVMAWVDLSLRLIERFQSPGLMLEVARQFLVEPGHREQRYYSTFSPDLSHGDAAVLKVQHWLQRNLQNSVTVHLMAAEAVLSERSFTRRFRKATGLSPIAYLQSLRVEKARTLLERTPDSLAEIAFAVGYQDAAALRTVFHRQIGLNPQQYRQRFSVTEAQLRLPSRR